MPNSIKPWFSSQISLGNILSVISAIVAALGMIFVMEARSQANAKNIEDLKVELSSQELRMRKVETEQARADERFSSILIILGKIEVQLERIEGRN